MIYRRTRMPKQGLHCQYITGRMRTLCAIGGHEKGDEVTIVLENI